ncbi:hypothetical protein HUU05_26735 [candidate division KSB1 bacterium]|nr:hypothetical protein [candidate division KSB1 bacterium]
MNLVEILQAQSEAIITASFQGMQRVPLQHYEQGGAEQTRERLRALYQLVVQCVSQKNVAPIIAHAESIAAARFASGFDLYEVQTAFNVLEEATWNMLLKNLPPAEYAHALGLVGTVLGAGKDALARRYVEQASRIKAPSLNLQALFAGTEGG